ncbi:MAG: PAS domain-containing protein, partial [Sphingomonadales bacterium]|nr:PAS domain-containing protein [Sphingomonadales bacterium]
MADAQGSEDSIRFLTGGGQTGALIRTHDWSQSPLGPIGRWPQSLKTATALLLRSPVPIVMLWGEDGVMIYNDAYSVFAGARHPGLLGSKVREGWPEVADFNDNVMKVGLAGGTLAYRDQELTLHRHGAPDQVWMNLDYSPVLDENDQPAGVIAIVVETTARVLAERRQTTEADRQRRMFEQAPGFICTLRGPDHVFDFVNDAYKRLFGDRGSVGRTVREVFPEIEGQGFFELLDQVYLTGERHVASAAPIRFRETPDADEEERFLDFIYAPVFDPCGKVTGIFCEGHDVTDAYRAEIALRESRAVLDFTLKSARVGDWDLDLIHDTSRRSLRHDQCFGYTDPIPEWGFEAFIQHVHPEDRANIERQFREAVTELKDWHFECRVVWPDGSIHHIAAHGSIYRTGEGEATRMLGIVSDITDQKRAESLQITQNRILQAAAGNAPIGKLLDTMLRTVEAQSTSGMLCSILLADEDGLHLRHGAAPSLPDAYNTAIDGIAIGSAVGSCGTAAHRKEPVHVTDIDTDPLWVDFRDLALAHSLRACWSTPILST